jgi:hypothetical protein
MPGFALLNSSGTVITVLVLPTGVAGATAVPWPTAATWSSAAPAKLESSAPVATSRILRRALMSVTPLGIQ